MVDIERILSGRSKSEIKAIAKAVFYKNKYPGLALDRVRKGEAFLDTEQAGILANKIGCSICELYEEDNWKASYSEGVHIFEKGEFRAEVRIKKGEVRIFHNKKLYVESALFVDTLPISAFLKEMDEIINNIEL